MAARVAFGARFAPCFKPRKMLSVATCHSSVKFQKSDLGCFHTSPIPVQQQQQQEKDKIQLRHINLCRLVFFFFFGTHVHNDVIAMPASLEKLDEDSFLGAFENGNH